MIPLLNDSILFIKKINENTKNRLKNVLISNEAQIELDKIENNFIYRNKIYIILTLYL